MKPKKNGGVVTKKFPNSKRYDAEDGGPWASVRILGPLGQGGVAPKLECLVDTGADYFLIPADAFVEAQLRTRIELLPVKNASAVTETRMICHDVSVAFEGREVSAVRVKPNETRGLGNY